MSLGLETQVFTQPILPLVDQRSAVDQDECRHLRAAAITAAADDRLARARRRDQTPRRTTPLNFIRCTIW